MANRILLCAAVAIVLLGLSSQDRMVTRELVVVNAAGEPIFTVASTPSGAARIVAVGAGGRRIIDIDGDVAEQAPAEIAGDLPKHVAVASRRERGGRSQIRVFVPNPPLSEAAYREMAVRVTTANGFDHALVSFFDWEDALVGWDGRGGADLPDRRHWLCHIAVSRDGKAHRAFGFFVPDEELTGIPRSRVVR